MVLRAVKEKVPLTRLSFNLKYEEFEYYDIPWHTHPEYEIALLLKSDGLHYVGDYVSETQPDELFFFGPNLPHSWKNKNPNFAKPIGKQIIIQFHNDCFGRGFFNTPETTTINELFKRSTQGIKYFGDSSKLISKKLKKLFNVNDFQKMIIFLEILNEMATTKECEILSSHGYSGYSNKQKDDRMDVIQKYIIDNLHNKVELSVVAKIVGLTPQSLCTYLKKKTWKTFTFILNEIRVGYACKKLIESNTDIKLIAYDSGYNNISFFYRQFKKHTGYSPAGYRKAYYGRTVNDDLFIRLGLLK